MSSVRKFVTSVAQGLEHLAYSAMRTGSSKKRVKVANLDVVGISLPVPVDTHLTPYFVEIVGHNVVTALFDPR